MRRLRLGLALALAACLLPASASAHHHHHRHHHRPVAHAQARTLAQAVAIGVAYWGSPPCGGQFTVTLDPTLPADENGLAQWWTSGSDGSFIGCSARIAVGLPWPDLCTTVVHELGHLHGLGHSTDPNNVMYPVELPSTRPPACRS